MLNKKQTHLLLLTILLLYLLLAVGYGLVNPLFEAPDEQHHFFTIRYIAAAKTLPTISTAGELARQEAAQPPLYYVLAAPLLTMVDTTGAEAQLWSNPTVQIGAPRPINVNSFVHTDFESWPWVGYPLAAHLVRFLSTIIGLGTLLAVYGCGRLFWPESPVVALLAAALVAFLPQFAFLHGAISNDVLIIFLCSFALWQLTWLWQRQITTSRLILLGLTIGLATLTKMAGLLLLPLSILVLAMVAWRDRPAQEGAWFSNGANWWRELILPALLVVVPALLVSGWLLWRNWTHYGDITAANQFVTLAGGNRYFSLRQVWNDMDRVFLSAVAFFGWMNVLAPPWLYLIWAALLLLAGGGWLFAAWRKRTRQTEQSDYLPERAANRSSIAIWMGVWVALICAAWLRFMMQTPADQGRLLFPTLLPVALFVARGLVLWRRRWLSWLVAIAALFTSAYALLVVIPGAFDTALLLTESDMPPEADRPALDMGYGIELLAVQTVTQEMKPGEWAWVDLYWRIAESVDEAPFERLGLYGRDNAQLGGQVNYHGGGSYPANQWPAGQVVRDRVGVQLAADAELPAQLRLLLRIDQEREPLEIARVKAVPASWPQTVGEPLATLGEGIELTAVSVSPERTAPGSTVIVEVQWQVKNAPAAELTTFVHLGDPAQAPLVQGDGPAVNGDYPTSLWAAGEVINDSYELVIPDNLPPGSYPLHIGFYSPQNGARLPVAIDGQAQAYDAYLIGVLTVDD